MTMLKYENGEYKDMTAEEIATLQQEELQPTFQPTLEERLAALEALLAEKEGK